MTEQNIPNPFIPKVSLAEVMRALAGSMEPTSYVRALLVTAAGQIEAQANICLAQQQTLNVYLSAQKDAPEGASQLDLLKRAEALTYVQEENDGTDDSDPS